MAELTVLIAGFGARVSWRVTRQQFYFFSNFLTEFYLIGGIWLQDILLMF